MLLGRSRATRRHGRSIELLQLDISVNLLIRQTTLEDTLDDYDT